MTTTNSAQHDNLYRFLIAGDRASGRSTFLLRYSDGIYRDDENPANILAADFKIKRFQSPKSNKTLILQIWDVASRESTHNLSCKTTTITSSYYRGAAGVFILFDVTDRNSFLAAKRFFDDSERYSIEHVQRILVATKLDLIDKREVSSEEAKELADHFGIPYIETSSKDNMNVEEAVSILTMNVEANWDKISQDLARPRFRVQKTPDPPAPSTQDSWRCTLL